MFWELNRFSIGFVYWSSLRRTTSNYVLKKKASLFHLLHLIYINNWPSSPWIRSWKYNILIRLFMSFYPYIHTKDRQVWRKKSYDLGFLSNESLKILDLTFSWLKIKLIWGVIPFIRISIRIKSQAILSLRSTYTWIFTPYE